MINSVFNINNSKNFGSIGLKPSSNSGNFAKILGDSLEKVSSYQNYANDSIVSFIKGDENEIHDVMISMQEAKLTLQAVIEIRNKLIESYQEISNVQI